MINESITKRVNIFSTNIHTNKDRNRNLEFNKIKKENQFITHQEAYDIIDGIEFCYCGNKAKFVSLKRGYSLYCSEKCHDIKNGYDIKQIIHKIREGWEPAAKNFIKIKALHNINTQELYDLAFGITLCLHCTKIASFSNFKKGYRKFCSVSCSSYYKDYTRTEEKNNIIQEKRQITCMQKYGVINNLLLIDVKGEKNIFSKENTSKKSILAKEKKLNTMLQRHGTIVPNIQKHLLNKVNFNQNYIMSNFVQDNKFDCDRACEYFNCTRTAFQKFKLPKRINVGESWIYDIIGGIKNDRTFIKPLELDILNHEFKLAVEFNGLAWHSFGISVSSTFNNPVPNNNHLNKTTLVENKNYQLFHIFENEFINKNKRYIWESVIKSKMNLTNSVFARKCSIKEINSKTATTFLNENHLQGGVNSKVRIGLFYNNELVSLMTFGKARRAKWKGDDSYELYRFCSKLNTTIVGGASKLLKYFVMNYKPKFIISYANRRWSQGNLYVKLGFEFIENTAPNYFYFKGGDHSKLLSREQFQKHKLKDKLDTFDESLTETENMFNNGYRKIYDCGSKIFIKRF